MMHNMHDYYLLVFEALPDAFLCFRAYKNEMILVLYEHKHIKMATFVIKF